MSELWATDLLRPYLVGEIMSAPVYSARPDESLRSAGLTMRRQHVSGLPVVNARGRVVGVLSEKDILEVLNREVGVGHSRGILDLLLGDYENEHRGLLLRSSAALLNTTVADAMSLPAVTVDSETPLVDAALLLRKLSINRVPVVRGEKLVGIITREDVLKVLESDSSVAGSSKERAERQTPLPAH
ncbi:MAG: CBS domain-containing protein [Thermoplasmata archaeon]